jgi:hypothetical protein
VIWLFLAIFMSTVIVIAGRAHSRRLNELENLLLRHKNERN